MLDLSNCGILFIYQCWLSIDIFLPFQSWIRQDPQICTVDNVLDQ